MNTKQFEKDFENLVGKKDKFMKLLDQYNKSGLIREYQIWFTEACEVVKHLIPNRTPEFQEIYDDRIKYTLGRPHFLRDSQEYDKRPSNVPFNDITSKGNQELCDTLKNNLEQQFAILESAKRKLKSSLMNIKTLTQANLFNSELDMVEELRKNGFLRPAGVVAGVVLESHLKTILLHKNIDLKDAKGLAKYNDLLKKNEFIDVPVWRNIQFLTDLRNRCCHKDNKEPTDENISDLIEGVKKIIKTVF